jgi:flagellar basal-body rod modification protein FlgD
MIDPTRLAGSSGRLSDSTTPPGTAASAGDPASSDFAQQLSGQLAGLAGAPRTASDDVAGFFGMKAEDFMKLFIAQFKNQDPSNPVDDQQLLGQFAQFTQIATLDELSRSMRSSRLAEMSALIGKEVVARGADGMPISGVVERVTQSASGLALVVAGQPIALADVIEVRPVAQSAE